MKEMNVAFLNPTEELIGKPVRWKADVQGTKIRRNSIVGTISKVENNIVTCEIYNRAYNRIMKDGVTPIFSIGTKNN